MLSPSHSRSIIRHSQYSISNVRKQVCRKESCVIIDTFPEVLQRRYASDESSKSSEWWALSSDAAKSYIQSLRLRTASALTASLSTEDRDILLKPYLKNQEVKDINTSDASTSDDVKTEEDTMSIGEAIASAVAQEARRSEASWERRKDDIYRQAEKAALERVQNDVQLLEHRKQHLSEWAKDLQKDILSQKERQKNMNVENEDAIDVNENHHPILGKAHVDLGYKKIFIVPANKLAAIPIWDKQRAYRHDRAKNMAADKMKTIHLGLPGVITLHESKNGVLSILDGQHRVGMMAVLEHKKQNNSKNGNEDLDKFSLNEVLVEVFKAHDPQHDDDTWAEELFTEINKAEPVKLVDMPGIAKVIDRRVITVASNQLLESYPDMFKPSQRCRPPHLNIDNLRDAIFAAGILSKYEITSPKALLEWMLDQNMELATEYESGNRSYNVSKNAIEKAKRYQFYLGLDSSWLYKSP